GSGNVIDTATGNLIFQKGLTYSFNVGPGTGSGDSRSLSIDVIDPAKQVAPEAWLDDCTDE
ncbi:MAG: hypothetical protein AABW68_03700, partial [archaeon]